MMTVAQPCEIGVFEKARMGAPGEEGEESNLINLKR
jgi:hypothetical protein